VRGELPFGIRLFFTELRRRQVNASTVPSEVGSGGAARDRIDRLTSTTFIG
jgi:hypothetical protein